MMDEQTDKVSYIADVKDMAIEKEIKKKKV